MTELVASVLGVYGGYRLSVWMARHMWRFDLWLWNKCGKPGPPPPEPIALRLQRWLKSAPPISEP